jgi:T5SS/PEP-CTERM-associated repeat protein
MFMRARLLFRALIFAIVLLTTAEFAFPQAFTVTIEGPGVQVSSLFTNPAAFGATNVVEETFNELKTGFISKSVPFAGNSAIGSYDHLLIEAADAFGGAGGTGNYMTVNTSINKASQPTTLTLTTPERYFGLWWSAGDPFNLMSFYSGSTLLESFQSSDVVNFINAQPNKSAYYGNPNNGKDASEPFAFLNFFANPSNPSVTFNRIVFSNVGSSGFEQDNHTLAATYTDIAGMDISSNTPVDLGAGSGSTDSKGVEGPGSTLNDSGTAVIGGNGTGDLAVTDGGTVNAGNVVIGQDPGSTGMVDVTGPGSSVDTTGTAVIGQDGSDGMLIITDQGIVNTGSTVIGQDPGSTGMIVVDGGTVNTGSAVIGQDPGSNGMVVITGAGSIATDTGSAVIGDGGSGTLMITNGGKGSDTNATVGDQAGSSGTVMVDGSGSQWTNTGSLDVGPAGSGLVDVSDGGIIVADDGTTIGPNGILTGNSTITTPILINNGTVAPSGPDDTPGTLTLNGNYQQGPGGVLDTEIGGPQPSQADQVKVTGSAKLDGTLDITSLNNYHPSPGNSYELISANGGLSGQFSNIADSANTNGLSRVDIYGSNGLLVAYLPPGVGVINMSISTPLPATLNAGNLNALLVPLLDPTAEQLSSLYEIWFSDANTQRFNIEDRFDDLAAGSTGFVSNISYAAPPPTGKEVTEGKGVTGGKQAASPSALQQSPENRWGVWVTGYGDFVNVEDDGSAQGYNFTTGGVSLGIDYRITQHFVMGLMGGYSHSWTNLTPSGSTDVDSGWGGVYSGYFSNGFYANGAVYGGHYTFESARPGLLGMANGSSDGGELSTYLAGGYDFHLGHLSIGPLAGLQYALAGLGGFTERGSVAPLKVSSDSQDSLVTDVGFRAVDNLPVGNVFLRPFVRVAWEHEYFYSSLPISAGLADISNSPATIAGPSVGHDSAVINAGLTVQWTARLSTYVSYDGQLGRSRYDSNGVSGGLRYAF